MVEKQSSTDKHQMKQIFGKMPRIILTDIFADQVSYFGNLVSDFGAYNIVIPGIVMTQVYTNFINHVDESFIDQRPSKLNKCVKYTLVSRST